MLAILLPFMLGVLSVIQNGLNRTIGLSYGLATAVLINVAFATLLAIIFLFAARGLVGPELNWLSGSMTIKQFSLWHLLPGTFGFLIVLGLPFSINQLGASRVFVFFVAAQILASLFWDLFVTQNPVVTTRVLGAILTVLGVLLVSIR